MQRAGATRQRSNHNDGRDAAIAATPWPTMSPPDDTWGVERLTLVPDNESHKTNEEDLMRALDPDLEADLECWANRTLSVGTFSVLRPASTTVSMGSWRVGLPDPTVFGKWASTLGSTPPPMINCCAIQASGQMDMLPPSTPVCRPPSPPCSTTPSSWRRFNSATKIPPPRPGTVADAARTTSDKPTRLPPITRPPRATFPPRCLQRAFPPTLCTCLRRRRRDR